MKKNLVIAVLSIALIVVVIASLVLSSGNFNPAPATATSTPVPPTSTSIPTSTSMSEPASITDTPDPCAQQNLQILVLDFNRISREYDDLSAIAQNTPREQLAPFISQMQAIRRKSEDFIAPTCMNTLKEYQLAYMNVYNDVLLALYSTSQTKTNLTKKDQILINQGVAQALDSHNKYMIEMARLLGVTPSVPTPPPASETPATLQTTETPTSG